MHSLPLTDDQSVKTEIYIHTQYSQCDYASSYASALRTHVKIHSGEKSNKCNQCDYASSRASHLRTHLKIHSGEKSNNCNQFDFASSQAGHLRKYLTKHCGEPWRITLKRFPNSSKGLMSPKNSHKILGLPKFVMWSKSYLFHQYYVVFNKN